MAAVQHATARDFEISRPAEPLPEWFQSVSRNSTLAWEMDATCGARRVEGIALTHVCLTVTFDVPGNSRCEVFVLFAVPHDGETLIGPPVVRNVAIFEEAGFGFSDADRLSALPRLLAQYMPE